jgi:hypothetical protein
MITYHYQVLRYLPDRTSEEFVNIGVVVLDEENYDLQVRFADKSARVSQFFPGINARYLNSTLRYIDTKFNVLRSRLKTELQYKSSKLDDITATVLPKDDSALIFSPIKIGRDINIDAATDDLFERLVLRNMPHDESDLRNDKEVWNKVYKSYFEKYNITDHLQPHKVKTKNDEFEFDKVFKNGKWNYFETVSFDLSRPDVVKNKVYKWDGKIRQLTTANEEINLYLLSVLPSNKKLKDFIYDVLDAEHSSNTNVKVISEREAEQLAKKIKKEIEEHKGQS